MWGEPAGLQTLLVPLAQRFLSFLDLPMAAFTVHPGTKAPRPGLEQDRMGHQWELNSDQILGGGIFFGKITSQGSIVFFHQEACGVCVSAC